MAEQNGSLTLDERRQLSPGTFVRYQREFDTHEHLDRVKGAYPSGSVAMESGRVIIATAFLALSDPPPCAEQRQQSQEASKAEPPVATRTKPETRDSGAPARAGKPRGPTQEQLDARRAAVREYDRVLAEGRGIDAALTSVNRDAAACGLSKGRWTVQLISWHRRSLKMPAATQGPKSKPKPGAAPRRKPQPAPDVAPIIDGAGDILQQARYELARLEGRAEAMRTIIRQAEEALGRLRQAVAHA